ncbi:sulfite exporter TauE/SafE family protein [Cytophaga hutchinsonii]|nr:sulfite exporter TauE/SafE family protein [Cytophaga hutchinsonii]SFX50563.1 hypothetical protein SAMN04487930_10514 [Cytophaga hutchinsonii ATCC 33406]
MIWAGLIMGILGSLHCIGMCGPIALALPIQTADKRMRLLAALFYNSGRAVTYSILGAIVGTLGAAFKIADLQQIVSIASGCMLVVLILAPFIFRKTASGKTWIAIPYVHALKQSISGHLKQHTFSSLFVIGLLNGLLPCGLVSLTLIGSIAMEDVFQSSLYMALFGLGTLPAMVALIFTKNYIPASLKHLFQKAVPVFVCALGIVLILRGMNLGIPYVSPAADKSGCAEVSCH